MQSCFGHPNALNSCPPCALSHPFKMRVCKVRRAEGGLHLVLAHLGKLSGFTKQNVFQGLPWQVPACLPLYLVERQPPRSLQRRGASHTYQGLSCRGRMFIQRRTLEGMGIPEALQTSGRTRHFFLEPFAFYEFYRSCSSLVPPLVAPSPPPLNSSLSLDFWFHT